MSQYTGVKQAVKIPALLFLICYFYSFSNGLFAVLAGKFFVQGNAPTENSESETGTRLKIEVVAGDVVVERKTNSMSSGDDPVATQVTNDGWTACEIISENRMGHGQVRDRIYENP
ncbi:hypothetical protein GWI33_001213 [Rhynchophorus ferrugineus]|uniref:Uncharacterized protein n=1 Tax=Rhynchophorus ferrugineus TaxID=354439 RepID=A0A834ISR3_RHYFE|nr:hypothetical protein GWI33_001213 [Rhynchophorus ferrugineus]